MMTEVHSFIVAFLVLAGAVFSLLATVGLLRFPDVYTRIHAASKAGLVGAGLILLAVGINSLEVEVGLRVIIGVVFLMMTTPVSAHLLARAASLAGYPWAVITKSNDLIE